MVSNPAGKGEEQHGTLVTHSTRAKPQGSESLAVEERCSMGSRARLGPIPTQAEREAPPPQTHIPLRQCCYLSFKGYSKQIKGKKNADIVCLREANCKQLCHGAAFHLDQHRGSQCWSTAQALGAHGCAKAESAQSQVFCRLGAGSRRKINQESCRGGYLHFCCLTFLPAYLFLVPQDVTITSLSSA